MMVMPSSTAETRYPTAIREPKGASQMRLNTGSMRLPGDLWCCYDLLCPIRRSFKFAFFQWTFRPVYEKAFRRNHQYSSLILESVRDRLGGIAEYVYQEGQYEYG